MGTDAVLSGASQRADAHHRRFSRSPRLASLILSPSLPSDPRSTHPSSPRPATAEGTTVRLAPKAARQSEPRRRRILSITPWSLPRTGSACLPSDLSSHPPAASSFSTLSLGPVIPLVAPVRPFLTCDRRIPRCALNAARDSALGGYPVNL